VPPNDLTDPELAKRSDKLEGKLDRRRARTEDEALKQEPRLSKSERGAGAWLSLIGLGVIMALPIAVAVLSSGDLRWIAITIGATLLFNLLVFGVTRVTNRFVWYALAVFLSVPILGGLAEMIRTTRNPQVQPIAIIRKGDDLAVCGVYVTETDKRLYIGRLAEKGHPDYRSIPANMSWIPVADVDMYKLGGLVPQGDVVEKANELATQLYADRGEDQLKDLPSTTTVIAKSTNGWSKTRTTTTPSKERHPLLRSRPQYGLDCTQRPVTQVTVHYDP
jgi:hypothetical protein